MLRALWWLAYTAAGVWLQEMTAGLDFLVPGLLLAMQRERPATAVWLALAWIVVQEGLGSLAFGFVPAWYGGLLLFYQVGRWLFDQKSFLFVCLAGLVLSVWGVGLTLALAGLEEAVVAPEPLMGRALLQALAFPLVWWLANACYPKRLKSHEQSA